MSISSGVVVAPVSISDVQSAIGSSSTDLATLCTGSTINKWARYKPVRYNSVGVLTEAQRRSVRYGLVIATQDNNQQTLAKLARDTAFGNVAYWRYDTPRGGGYNEPYRLHDFAKNPSDSQQTINISGYNSHAQAPFTTDMANAYAYYRSNDRYVVNKAEVDEVRFIATLNSGYTDLLMTDLLFNLTDYCLKVEIYNVEPISGSSTIPSPTKTYIGSVINTTNQSSIVSVPTSDITVNTTVYILAGLQRVVNGSTVKGSAILAPRTPQQEGTGRTPYHFVVSVESYLTMKFQIAGLGYGSSGTFTYDSGQRCWKTSSMNSTVLFINLQVSHTSHPYYFARSTTSIPSGGTRMTIYIRSYDFTNEFELTPSNSSRQTSDPTTIPSTQNWYNIYGRVDLSSVITTQKLMDGHVHFFALRVALSDGTIHDAGSFAIQKS